MTTALYPLGRPRPAAKRGGDCRARDLNQGRNVHGGHRFAATTHARINNGLLRLTVGATGVAPSLTVEARRGRVVVEDYLSDILSDTLPGIIGTPAWLAVGTLTIDSPSAAALLTGVRIASISSGVVTLQLVAPLMGDAFVTLRRGERMVRIQHGDTRARPLVDIDRRVRLTASPSPVGIVGDGLVEENAPAIDGMPRFLASDDTVTIDAGTFSMTAASVPTATFSAGVANLGFVEGVDNPSSMRDELADTSRTRLRVT